MTDRVTLIKQSGERVPDIPASVQRNKVFVNDASFVIEPGDLLERVASNGLRETYEVIDPGFYENFHGIEAHYQITVRRSVSVLARPTTKKRQVESSSGLHPWRAIRNWWRGRWINSTLESLFPAPGEVGSPDGHYERPWLARAWLLIAEYWVKHWQFTLNALITIGGILVAAYVAIKYGK